MTVIFVSEGVDQGLDFEAALSDSDLPKWKSGPQVRSCGPALACTLTFVLLMVHLPGDCMFLAPSLHYSARLSVRTKSGDFRPGSQIFVWAMCG